MISLASFGNASLLFLTIIFVLSFFFHQAKAINLLLMEASSIQIDNCRVQSHQL